MLRKLFLISLIWAVLILIVCAIPGNSLPQSRLFSIPNFDKIIHALLYFPLAFMLGAEFHLSARTWLKLTGPILTMAIITVYGGAIEILQDKLFVNRSADLEDVLFDVIGGLAGLTVFYLFFRPLFTRMSRRK